MFIDRERWQALEPLLDRVLELPPDEQVTWLENLRTTSPHLAEQLTELLASDVAAQRARFLEAQPDLPPVARLAGLQVGAYTLDEPLGYGGMGSVWLAQRTDGRFDGVVAIKLLRLSLANDVGEARFRREGSLLARLAHPGIARLLDAGVTPSGQAFLVLEYVAGQRIDEYVRTHKLSLDDRIRLFCQVLDAVAHAHAHLVVHRDLKPSNILVTEDGTAKLLDFGIAKLLEMESEEQTAFTLETGRALTPEFAAPEQVRGDRITTATDVYALGVLLFLLLSGRHPTAEGCSTPDAVLRALQNVEPARLGLGDLDNVIAKALQKSPEERYQTVGAFADDLNRYLRNLPVNARVDSVLYRLRKFVRRNRPVVLTAATVVIALVTATAFSVSQMRLANRERNSALAEKKRADAQVEFQRLLLSDVGSGPTTLRDVLDHARQLLEREYTADPHLATRIALGIAGQYGELGEYDREAELVRRAGVLAHASGNPQLVLLVRCTQGYNLMHLHRTAEAVALFDSIRPLLPKRPDADAAACLQQRAEVHIRDGDFAAGAQDAGAAATMLESIGATRDMRYVDVLNTWANADENLKRGREALTLYNRIATLMDSTGRGNSSSRNVIRNNIGIALSNLGEMQAARPELQQAVAVFRNSNPQHEVHPAILINYCRTILFLQQLDSAAFWYRQLVHQGVVHRDPDQEDEGVYGMALVELMRGNLGRARRWVERENAVEQRLRSPRPANQPTLRGALAFHNGQYAEANRALAQALTTMGYDSGKRTYQMRAVLIIAARNALAASNPAVALQYARDARSIAQADPLTEKRSAYVGEARLLQGEAELALGDAVTARASFAAALEALRFGVGIAHPLSRAAERRLSQLAP